MIEIKDTDKPIVVAEKIIMGTRPYNATPLAKALAKAVTGDEKAYDTVDMFDLEEIKEIAGHLMVYYDSHKEPPYENCKPVQSEYEPVTAEDFAKTMSMTSAYSYMAWYSEALSLMERTGFVICKKKEN